jgi:hypothetical protein
MRVPRPGCSQIPQVARDARRGVRRRQGSAAAATRARHQSGRAPPAALDTPPTAVDLNKVVPCGVAAVQVPGQPYGAQGRRLFQIHEHMRLTRLVRRDAGHSWAQLSRFKAAATRQRKLGSQTCAQGAECGAGISAAAGYTIHLLHRWGRRLGPQPQPVSQCVMHGRPGPHQPLGFRVPLVP